MNTNTTELAANDATPVAAELRESYRTLEWARTPGRHGGNPYCQDHVKTAERLVAAHEGRPVEGWAAIWPTRMHA